MNLLSSSAVKTLQGQIAEIESVLAGSGIESISQSDPGVNLKQRIETLVGIASEFNNVKAQFEEAKENIASLIAAAEVVDVAHERKIAELNYEAKIELEKAVEAESATVKAKADLLAKEMLSAVGQPPVEFSNAPTGSVGKKLELSGFEKVSAAFR